MPDTAVIEGNHRRASIDSLTGRRLKQERRCAEGPSGRFIVGRRALEDQVGFQGKRNAICGTRNDPNIQRSVIAQMPVTLVVL